MHISSLANFTIKMSGTEHANPTLTSSTHGLGFEAESGQTQIIKD